MSSVSFSFSASNFHILSAGNTLSGTGRISGVAPYIVTKAGSPARCLVGLIYKPTPKAICAQIVALQYSKADGTYSFDLLNTDKRFTVIAFDPDQTFNAVIRDNITPAPMP